MAIECDTGHGHGHGHGRWLVHGLDLGIPLYGGHKEAMTGSNPVECETPSILVSAVLDFMRKTSPNTVVIPIHDSFVVKQSELAVLLDALGFAEHTLAGVMDQELRIPTLKATVVKGLESPSYISMIKEHRLEG